MDEAVIILKIFVSMLIVIPIVGFILIIIYKIKENAKIETAKSAYSTAHCDNR
jgi:uncharacterized membrane protein